MTREGSIDRARMMRRGSTRAERALWNVLRGRGLGAKFRRQVPIGPFIVDFAALAERLVVEVDGGQHAGDASDGGRDAYLASHGFVVLRFWNNEVLGNLDGVVHSIRSRLLNPSP